MNDDNWYQDSDRGQRSYREDETFGNNGGTVEPKPGMRTGVKVLIGCGVVGGVMALMCCGGFVYMGSQVAGMMTDDPVKIEEIREGIADVELPEEFSPQGGLDAEMFGMGMEMAIYEGPDSDALLLMQMKGPTGFDAKQMQQSIEQQLDQQGQNRELDIESTEERTITIAGAETTIEIAKGKDSEGKEMRQVTGVFQGRGGAAFVMYFSPEESWDEQRVVQLLESIQTVDGQAAAEDVEELNSDEPVEHKLPTEDDKLPSADDLPAE